MRIVREKVRARGRDSEAVRQSMHGDDGAHSVWLAH